MYGERGGGFCEKLVAKLFVGQHFKWLSFLTNARMPHLLLNLVVKKSVACFLSSRTDLLCSPRIAAGEALCLVTHLVSYIQGKQELYID